MAIFLLTLRKFHASVILSLLQRTSALAHIWSLPLSSCHMLAYCHTLAMLSPVPTSLPPMPSLPADGHTKVSRALRWGCWCLCRSCQHPARRHLVLSTLLKDFMEDNSVHFYSQAKLLRSNWRSTRRGGCLPYSGSLIFYERNHKNLICLFPEDLGISLSLGSFSVSLKNSPLKVPSYQLSRHGRILGWIQCRLSLWSLLLVKSKCIAHPHTDTRKSQAWAVELRFIVYTSGTALGAMKIKSLTLRDLQPAGGPRLFDQKMKTHQMSTSLLSGEEYQFTLRSSLIQSQPFSRIIKMWGYYEKNNHSELFEISVKLKNVVQYTVLLSLFRLLRDVLHKYIHWLPVNVLPMWRVHKRLVHSTLYNIWIFVGKRWSILSTIPLPLNFLIWCYHRLVTNFPTVSSISTFTKQLCNKHYYN